MASPQGKAYMKRSVHYLSFRIIFLTPKSIHRFISTFSRHLSTLAAIISAKILLSFITGCGLDKTKGKCSIVVGWNIVTKHIDTYKAVSHVSVIYLIFEISKMKATPHFSEAPLVKLPNEAVHIVMTKV